LQISATASSGPYSRTAYGELPPLGISGLDIEWRVLYVTRVKWRRSGGSGGKYVVEGRLTFAAPNKYEVSMLDHSKKFSQDEKYINKFNNPEPIKFLKKKKKRAWLRTGGSNVHKGCALSSNNQRTHLIPAMLQRINSVAT